jgi:hypothetical protein
VIKFTRGPAYLRLRAVTGTLFVVLGLAILIRTVASFGIGLVSVAPLVLGAALVALGTLRVRDYVRFRSGGA